MGPKGKFGKIWKLILSPNPGKNKIYVPYIGHNGSLCDIYSAYKQHICCITSVNYMHNFKHTCQIYVTICPISISTGAPFDICDTCMSFVCISASYI